MMIQFFYYGAITMRVIIIRNAPEMQKFIPL